MSEITIAPSILSADFSQLGLEVELVIKGGASMIHFDVMDNHYVPNLSFGPNVCRSLRDFGISTPIDVHLMTEGVDELILAFAAAGASRIAIHPESTKHLDRSLSLITDNGCEAGLAFNPTTPLSYLDFCLDKLDYILLMMVNPGFGGQQLIESLYPKIKQAKALAPQLSIQVDGGVNVKTIKQLYLAGADCFVAGSAIFNQPDYRVAIEALKAAISA